MITYEIITPSKAKDVELTYGIHKTLYGWCVVSLMNKSVCTLSFIDKKDKKQAEKCIKEVWPVAKLKYDEKGTKGLVDAIFSNKKKEIHLLLKGTTFQVKVWEALMDIPKGATSTYAKVAEEVGSKNAVRAVGTACGKNPIGYLIPCHRVLTSTGKLGGYHWGLKRKEFLLLKEAQ